MDAMRDKVLKLAKEKNAIILAHYYQTPDIQEIADFKGDSLALAQYAAETDADIILFAGVHFMGETAKILNPKRKVLIPDMNAGCSLAESCPKEDFAKFKAQYPDHIVISYINCSAEIKTLSDVICTSGNAVQIVESYPKDQKIIFAPDKNLGRYINEVTGREMVLWDGSCEVHDILSSEKIMQMKVDNPDAILIAHPECPQPVLILADFVGSTTAMLNYTKNSDAKKFIVATETGILHQMQKDSPDKEFLIVPADESCSCNDCAYMKLNTMEKIYLALKNEKPEIILPEQIMKDAKAPLVRMLELSTKSN
ncbi:quinolinate synthase NadA [Ancylomarina salipaludis]|uniref:Quinolinate synthase n=1 Tax=Ancylomarina salipaludis TaxID=2501299 RepID=A0A4Q1JLD4_9BACT|nr:quinolinate synthase NadA [Ancylomarina salipaludis]RXQ94382.1 quinolinate synthase NadA [Ancylomarina salipaludis]